MVGAWIDANRALDPSERPIKDNQIEWVDKLQAAGKIEKQMAELKFTLAK